MHNAPSVSYPVGRCAFQRRLFVWFAVLTSAVLLAWALNQGLTATWYAAVAAAALGLLLGWRALGQAGTLTWDGQVWCLHDLNQGQGHEDALGDVHVALDVQKALLLRWQPASDTLNAKPQWLWLGSQASDNRWQDLRRAVYQRMNK
jgi:toxin CptA